MNVAIRVLDADLNSPPRRHLMPVDDDTRLRLPPHSREAEQSVLGALLQDNAVIEIVSAQIAAATDFYLDAHREIFRHVQLVLAAARPADVVTVGESLDAAGKLDHVGGMAYLGKLAQEVPTSANAEHYAKIVAERARRRALIATASEIAEAAYAPAATDSGTLLLDAQERLEGLARPDDVAGPRPMDFAALAMEPVPERRFRVGRVMPIGVPGLFTGHGGAGKTQAALHLAICIALGLPFFGEDVAASRVAYVSTEDDRADLHLRIAQQLRVLGATLSDLEGRLFVFDYTAIDPVLVVAGGEGKVLVTPRYAALRKDLRRYGVTVVMLDNLATLCAVDIIKPGHATQTIALCGQLVPEDGNAILIAHVDKATARAGTSREAYSGTAAWHNRSRWRWSIFEPGRGTDATSEEEPNEDDGRRTLRVDKVNGAKPGLQIALRITDTGAIAPSDAGDGLVASIARRNERQAVLASIAEADARGMRVPGAKSGPSTGYEILLTMPSFPAALRGKAGKRRLLAMLTQMRADGDIIAKELRTDGRHLREFLYPARVCE